MITDINNDLDQLPTLNCQIIKQNDSASFRLLLKLIVDSPSDIPSLKDSLYISSSHFYRTVTLLTNFLNQLGLSLATINGKLQITGDEMLVRSTVFVILTSTHQSIFWPFNVPKEQIINTLIFETLTKDYPQSVQSQLLYFLALTDTRLKQNSFLSNLYTIELVPILNILSEENDLTAPFPQFPPSSTLDDTLSLRERDLFNFLIRLLVANVDSPAQKKIIGLRWIATHPITDYCYKFCTLFFSHYSLTETDENYTEFMYFSVLYHIAALYPQAQFANVSTIEHILPKITDYAVEVEKISTLYTSFSTSYYSNHSRKVTVPTDFIQFFSQFSFLFLQTKQTTTLTIYVSYSQNIIGENFIKEKLMATFSTDSLLFTVNPREADIIISDRTYEKIDDAHHFPIPSVFGFKALKTLFSFVQTCLFNAQFSSDNSRNLIS